jgi:hypothetical protein
VGVVAVKPQRTVIALAYACSRTVAAGVLMDPRADDGVLRTMLIRKYALDLDTEEVGLELHLGAIIELSHA